MGWVQSKNKTVPSEVDAELNALAKKYAELNESSSQPKQSLMGTKTSTPAPHQPNKSTTLDSAAESLPALPMDEVIRGNSITYTRAEAKLYANEEPCDSWRHFDVHPIPVQVRQCPDIVGIVSPSSTTTFSLRHLPLWIPS
jgi:hypothetical protein